MASAAQIAANRANARKNTGPRTAEGKAISSRNASRHGLCSDFSDLCGEKDEISRALLEDLMEEHQPQGPTEEILVYKMAEQFRLIKRASHRLSMKTDANPGEYNAKLIDLFLRYYNTADRAFNRNLADLRKLQKERREQEAE